MKKVAIVCANGLGDALLSLIISQNFMLSGDEPTTFSNTLCGLKSWFPQHTILPYPDLVDYQKTFAQYDLVVAADHSILAETQLEKTPLLLIKEKDLDRQKTFVSNLAELCQKRLLLNYFQNKNGITPPSGLTHRRFLKRIIIHPMSLEAKRCWPAEKFIKLVTDLYRQGWAPAICVSQAERQEWESRLQNTPHIELPFFTSSEHLAAYVYESGWMIGNNSGIGHLASCLNIPTLSLFARKSYANLWRPGWGPGLVVTPPKILPGARLMNQHWKKLLGTKRVLKSFNILQKISLH